MQLLETLSVLRRRWFYVALGLLVGAVAGFVTAPGESDEAALFQGTHQLLVNPNSSSSQSLNLQQTVLVVRNGAVPERVAQRLAEGGQPEYTSVRAVADADLRSLDITAFSTTREGAALAADLFAQELNAELVAADQSILDQSLQAAQGQAASLQAQIDELNQQIFFLPEGDLARQGLENQRSALSQSLAEIQAQVQSIQAQGGVSAPLRTLEAARGRPAVTEGWRIPESKPVRAGMLGIFGLILGIAGAIGADRLDTRVRGKDDAERAFDLPVIAEIPPLPSGTKGRELLVATRPAAPFVEACRALRTVVLFAASSSGEPVAANGNSNGNGTDAPDTAQVILVTSPSAGEGKTTTAAHLAATLAEFGKRVLVISADFRRPRIHEMFDVAREPGLSDVLDSGSGRIRLSDLQMATSFKGVHLLPSGSPVDNPAQLLTETAQLIAAARSLFDFIVIDTPPLLVANDATELAAVADIVLLMAKADRTSREGARRSVEILRRVDAPLLGVVVAASHDTPTAYGYYRYRYYADTDQGTGRKGKRARAKAAKQTKVQSESLAATVATDRS